MIDGAIHLLSCDVLFKLLSHSDNPLCAQARVKSLPQCQRWIYRFLLNISKNNPLTPLLCWLSLTLPPGKVLGPFFFSLELKVRKGCKNDYYLKSFYSIIFIVISQSGRTSIHPILQNTNIPFSFLRKSILIMVMCIYNSLP